MNTVAALALALLALTCHAAPEADRITSLPRLHAALGTQYSGYLSVSGGNHLHYLFSYSRRDPARDPVVVWLNGGPGCSSLLGYLYENGPFMFSSSQPGADLYNNPFAWNNVSNVLFIESPVGVGFSYNDGGHTATNDNVTADINYEAVKKFFEKFPEFKNNEFFVTGESYAGIYVPMLSYRCAMDPTINFKGFATGNPVTTWNSFRFDISLLPFWYGHGIITQAVYSQALSACQGQNPFNNNMTMACNNILNTISTKFFNFYDVYNIYGDCVSRAPHMWFLNKVFAGNYKIGVTPPCTNAFASLDYLNLAETKRALHVKESITWEMCSAINYNVSRDSVLPEYEYVRENGGRIMTYSGDTDSSVPYTGTAYWAIPFGGTPEGDIWGEWYFQKDDGKQDGGHVTYFKNFTYVTVRGSGHMVPQFRPQAAYNMYVKFLQGKKL